MGDRISKRTFGARSAAVAAVSLSIMPYAAIALPATAPSYPSVEHASFHQLVFADDDVAVLRNVYPPHTDSGYHLHPRELFYVVIDPARVGTQKVGQKELTPPMPLAGSFGYNILTTEPFVHRFFNDDTRTGQNIAIEIRRPAPLGVQLSVRPANYVQIFDNTRMRAWRLILASGGAAPAMTQTASGVRVVVRGGLLVTTSLGLPDQTLALQKGDFSIQHASVARALRNAGQETIELVELELK